MLKQKMLSDLLFNMHTKYGIFIMLPEHRV